MIEPPLIGPWADSDTFAFEDVFETYGELIDTPDHPGLYWTDSATSTQYLSPEPKEGAPASGILCIITTGDAGEFGLQIYMLQLADETTEATTEMEASLTFTVDGVEE